ncbi:unnamed protein product [Acanthoscelides obtectus]|uniref:Methuselah N-terminal domain-containing protein n=1 Tax=Acanthoscelides obtectus TaxID=200917 RepID=A0A9P0LP49_ACAOB|nr:unnamed protein product [Acanthoscelides obtectus]CAK1675465.1 hypothetical protein AOBTE_LOCUS30234 [Acanthoscelides obtectus]
MKVIVVILVTCACFVYGSNVSNAVLNHNTNETCEERSVCVRKCCPQGMALKNRNCTPSDLEFGFPVYDGKQKVSDSTFKFDVVHGKSCKSGKVYKLGKENVPMYFVQRNGTLYCPRFDKERLLLYDEYCLENIVLPTHVEFAALICFTAPDTIVVEEYFDGSEYYGSVWCKVRERPRPHPSGFHLRPLPANRWEPVREELRLRVRLRVVLCGRV